MLNSLLVLIGDKTDPKILHEIAITFFVFQ